MKKEYFLLFVFAISMVHYVSQPRLDLLMKFDRAEEFEIKIPNEFNHSEQIDQTIQRMKKSDTAFSFNRGFTSTNFANATNRLIPGKTYKVKIFPILDKKDQMGHDLLVTSEECMELLKSKQAILVGGQGLTMVYDLRPDMFAPMKWIVSFDEKQALWKDSVGNYNVPMIMGRFLDGKPMFDLGFFNDDGWSSAYSLLAIFEK